MDCSAISDNQLLNHLALHLSDEEQTMTYKKKVYSQDPNTKELKLVQETRDELRIPTPDNPHTSEEIEAAFKEVE